MSLNAYHQARTYSETPRAVEYRLMNEITHEMVRARDAGLTGIALLPALHRNREMWSTFSIMCEDERNALPYDLRARIVSLALWVNRHTTNVVRGKEAIEDLIEINRIIMSGLERTEPTRSAA